MLDKLIKNANIVDGTGAPIYRGDVGIVRDKITLRTEGQEAEELIDASGLYLCPGFIDSHSHGDMDTGKDFKQICKTSQGVTTEICGNCGITMGPVGKGFEALLVNWISMKDKENIPWLYSFGELVQYLERQRKTTNMALFVGHNTLRIAVMGFSSRKPDGMEMEMMKALLREAMESGAMGLSTGLAYTPSSYSDTEELIELCRVVREYNGAFAAHMRNESADVVRSVEECIRIGREAEVPVFISHHKILGRKNWGLQKTTLRLIRQAREEGIAVTCDQYPYTCNMSDLNVCMPPHYFEKGTLELARQLKKPEIRRAVKEEMTDSGCGYDNYYLNAGGWAGVVICQVDSAPEAAGMTVEEYAARLGKDPFEMYFDLMAENRCAGTAVYKSMCEEDMVEIGTAPETIFGSDEVVSSLTGMTHPRSFGAFPQAICFFHKERHLMSLEEVIRRMTGKTAARHHLVGKGVIAEGMDADMVLFDYDRLEAKATYVRPYALTEGIERVYVNGQLVWKDRSLTGTSPGRILLHLHDLESVKSVSY